jgi:hypothetical protein
MTVAAGLALPLTTLLGAVGGWLIAVWSHHRSAELRRKYEQETADEDLYIALAMLRRSRSGAPAQERPEDSNELPDLCNCRHIR